MPLFFFSITSYLLLAFCQTKLTLLEICAFPSHQFCTRGNSLSLVPASTTQLCSFASPLLESDRLTLPHPWQRNLLPRTHLLPAASSIRQVQLQLSFILCHPYLCACTYWDSLLFFHCIYLSVIWWFFGENVALTVLSKELNFKHGS